MEKTFSVRRFAYAVAAFVAILTVATVVFRYIEEESWVDAAYRSVVTTTLTGLDTRPASTAGKVFSIFVLFTGVAIFLYVAGAIVEMIARGVFTGAWAERRRRRMIETIHDHYIICGYGRVGRRIAHEFRSAGVPYVVIDFNPAVIRIAQRDGETYVEGSGTNDEDLRRAGLERARGLVAASDSDVDNLYITLSARAARPDLQIVARASTEDAATKLDRAGADRIVQPYATAGQEMAQLMLKPQVAAFLEIVSTHAGPDLRFEEIVVTRASGQVGRTIRELRIRRDTGAVVITIRRSDGTFETTPSPDHALVEGDVLIAVGTETELRALEELFAVREAVAD
ncbi:MAG TPA: NAD-binding protein [Gaiellaceae bacterium]|nr:NAD-binding protein [Gaiellaceae bacterium]